MGFCNWGFIKVTLRCSFSDACKSVFNGKLWIIREAIFSFNVAQYLRLAASFQLQNVELPQIVQKVFVVLIQGKAEEVRDSIRTWKKERNCKKIPCMNRE